MTNGMLVKDPKRRCSYEYILASRWCTKDFSAETPENGWPILLDLDLIEQLEPLERDQNLFGRHIGLN